jgi:hypothetical protein
VPYIVAMPGRIAGGRVDNRMVSSLDITPTAAALAGAKLRQPSDGVDLMPYLTGKNAGVPNPHRLLARRPNFAIRDGAWKMWEVNRADPSEAASVGAEITPDGTHATSSPLGQYVMLYDLAADMGEKNNLSARKADVVAALRPSWRLGQGQHSARSGPACASPCAARTASCSRSTTRRMAWSAAEGRSSAPGPRWPPPFPPGRVGEGPAGRPRAREVRR